MSWTLRQPEELEKGGKAFQSEKNICVKAYGLENMGYPEAFNVFYYLNSGYLCKKIGL